MSTNKYRIPVTGPETFFGDRKHLSLNGNIWKHWETLGNIGPMFPLLENIGNNVSIIENIGKQCFPIWAPGNLGNIRGKHWNKQYWKHSIKRINNEEKTMMMTTTTTA